MNKPIATFNIQMKGMFKLEATNIKTGKKRLVADWFSNLITNQGLDFPGGGAGYTGSFGAAYIKFCHVGSGNSAPANIDVGLDALVGTTDGGSVNSAQAEASAPWFWTISNTYRFNAGVATGALREIGVGHSNDNVTLFSRALILDSGGNPTTINIAADEVLDVSYKLIWYPDQAMLDINNPVLGSFNLDIDGTPTNHNTQQALLWVNNGIKNSAVKLAIGSFVSDSKVKDNASFAPITSSQMGGGFPAGADNRGYLGSYVDGDHYLEWFTFWDLDDGNSVDGITGVEIQCGVGSFQVLVDPPIMKDNTKKLTLNFRMSWSRHP